MADKILVVDDSEDAARITEHILTNRGFQVRVANDGPRALALVAESAPDCILLDVMMPKMTGLQVLEKLKETPTTARIPVILLTAKDRDEDVLSGYKDGADYYIVKPFSAKQLMYGLRLVLGPEVASSIAPQD